MSTEIEPVEAETHIEIEAGQTTAIDADERRANEAALAPAEQSSGTQSNISRLSLPVSLYSPISI